MSRPRASQSRALPLLAAALLAVACPAIAGEVYQWKDAKGVTHYSDSPPPNKADYRNRSVRSDAPAPPEAAAAAKPADSRPADSSQCVMARQNLDRLKSNAPVGLDANNDGKPDAEMDAGQRAAQVQLAEAGIKAWCTPTVAVKP
ncbi:hypothetical protein J2X06_002401 [Lysobacter niastensis]|uniref:DUF4124 domain-containing protein n=1 Tax=Lysobacter niastensis TaxID=380629 RepID=A0ABU1WC75_9GAMM|nr:DUF4124 domain-containing protein [Lysobacter niastensis]MDR7135192.1 hypothetical protein [Lysobacter niastensis]